MKSKFFILIFLIIGSDTVFGQTRESERVGQLWTGYFNQTRFHKKWGAWLDVQLRTKEDFVSGFSQFLFRPGITYYLNDATKLTAGYAYIRHFPADNHSEVARPEHRPWQQLQWHTKYNRLRTMQYLRLEERYRRKVLNDSTLADGYQFNFRLRYNFLLQVPLTAAAPGRNGVSFIVNDEIHVNAGKKVVYNTFDQNRFFIGFAYHLNESDNLQLGYLNVYQQLPSGNQYKSINAARVSYFHNLDLRNKNDHP